MPFIIRLILLTLIAGTVAGCSGNTEKGKNTGGDVAPVPRRHAYPRIVIPDSLYSDMVVGTTALHIAVSDAAIVTQRISDAGNSQFVNAAYPKFNSTIFFTVTPVTRPLSAT